MPQDEFEEKCFSLNSADQAVVDDVIYSMEDEFMNSDDDDDEDDTERLSVSDAADIWLSNGCDAEYTFGYSEKQLRNPHEKNKYQKTYQTYNYLLSLPGIISTPSS